jgi:DNA-binding beta-propeller fold protein YncE
MYHFDTQANLLAQYPVSIDFEPTGMAVAPSGKTILVGHAGSTAEDFNYGGAVLDADDRLIIISASNFHCLPKGAGGSSRAVSSRQGMGLPTRCCTPMSLRPRQFPQSPR